MEEEQRKKKLEAGKERLAAFRKKKAKKKKKPANADDSFAHQGADGNLADASSCSDAQSVTGDSDQGSVGSYTSGDEWSAEEADLHSAVYYQTKLVDASRRVSELEEMVEGKQLALDKVIQENRQLKLQKPEQEAAESREESLRSKSDTMVNPTDLQSALAQRDQIIQQLTSRLRATAQTPDYTQETQTLAQQVALLQQQLQQAGETLNGQLNQHNVSAQALQEAKAEILALQTLLQEKEDVLVQVTLQHAQKTEEAMKIQIVCREKEQEMERAVQQYETKIQELESVVSQGEQKEKDYQSVVEKFELREKELEQCIQQHEVRGKELEAYVGQCADNEKTLRQTVVDLEGRLAIVTQAKETLASSMEATGMDEQQTIAKLTLELQNLSKDKDNMMNEFEKVRTRNNELETLYKDVESECSLKQSENDELRNRINTQQGEILALRSELDLLLQDEETSGQEVKTLTELLQTKEQSYQAQMLEKNSFISQLQMDIQSLQEERNSYELTIESLNSKVTALQSELSTSQSEVTTFRSQSEMYRSELEKVQKGRVVNSAQGDDAGDSGDTIAAESEFVVRTIQTKGSKTAELEVGKEKSFPEGISSVSESPKIEGPMQLEVVTALGSEVSSDTTSVAKSSEDVSNHTESTAISEEILKLKELCQSHVDNVLALENENVQLRNELCEMKDKLNDLETQNQIIVEQYQDSCSDILSLSSEFHTTCYKLKQSGKECERLTQELSSQIKENTSLGSKLEQISLEMTNLQATVADKETETILARQKAVELENDLKDLQDVLSNLKKNEDAVQADNIHCEKHIAEIEHLNKELQETKAGLAEVSLGAEKVQEDLQNQCDQYASEAAQLQEELSKTQQLLSQSKDQVDTLEGKCQIIAKEMDTEQEKVTSLSAQNEDLVKNIKQLEKDLESKTTELLAEQELSQSHQKESKLFAAEVKDLQMKLETLTEDHSSTLESVKLVKSDLDTSESQKEILAEEIAAIQQELISAAAESKKLSLQLYSKNADVEKLQKQCSSDMESFTAVSGELKETQQQFDALKMQFECDKQTWKSHLEEKENEVSSLGSDIEELRTVKQSIEEKDGELSSLRSELEELRTVKESMELKEGETQRQLTKLQDEVLKNQKEIEMLTEKLILAQEDTEKSSAKLKDLQADLLAKEKELENISLKLQETSLTVEKSQAENMTLLSEKEQLKITLEEAISIAEGEKTNKQATIESLQREVGSLQNELVQLKMDHHASLEKEEVVKSEVRSHLDVASAEVQQLQNALDIANKEVMNAQHEMEKLQSDYEVQLQQFVANMESLKVELATERGELATERGELDKLRTRLQCEEDAKAAVQSQLEDAVKEIQTLKHQVQVHQEETETAQSQKKDMDDIITIEQAARADIQSQLESLSSEFDKVINHERKLQKEIANYTQRIGMLIQQSDVQSEESGVSNLDEGLQLLEQLLCKMKDERIHQKENFAKQIADLETVNLELRQSEDRLKSEVESLNLALDNTKEEVVTYSSETNTLSAKVTSLQEEKEILKANFDSCMEDMQQKLSEQENQSRSLQSQLMETAKDRDMDNDQTKILYEDHISELEEKIARLEAELGDTRKIVSEYNAKQSLDVEEHENKIVEMEEKVVSLESENSRLQQQLSKLSGSFVQEKEEIKVIFESQISELEENCKSLESTILRLQEQMSDTTKAHDQEKQNLEQNIDIQLSEMEDKCRVLELTNGKLKRQMDEMMNDFRTEKEDMQKLYESQLLDLEERCSQSELTANKSMQHVSDISKDFGDEKDMYELTIQDLKQRCYDLEKSRDDVQERLELVSESAQQERKKLQDSMLGQIKDLQKKYTLMETEYTALKEVLAEKEQAHKDEMETKHADYFKKITDLEEQLSGETKTEKMRTVEEENILKETIEQYRVEIEILTSKKVDLEQMIMTHQIEIENLKSEFGMKVETLQTKCHELSTQLANKEREEKLHVNVMQTSAQASDEVAALRKEIDSYKSEVDRLVREKGEIEVSLVIERDQVKEATERFDELEAKYQKEMQELTEHTSGETKSVRALKEKIKSLNSKVVSSNQELSKEKQRVKAAKLAQEKSKKELENLRLTSEEEIQILRTRLEAWEAELIQRRQFVESESAATKQKAELETLVKNYEQQVENLTDELYHLKTQYHAKQERHVAASVPPAVDVFEPEPDSPDLLQTKPEFQVQSSFHPNSGADVPVVQGFQPEDDVEGFMIFEAESSEGLKQVASIDQNANVQVETHTSVSADAVISGDGFQPELDQSRADTFQPERREKVVVMDQHKVKSEGLKQVNVQVETHTSVSVEAVTSGDGFQPELDGYRADTFQPEDTEGMVVAPIPISMTSVSSVSTQTEDAPCEQLQNETSLSSSEEVENVRKQLEYEKEVLEEEYVKKMKKLEVDLKYDHQAAMTEYKKEVDKKMQQKLIAMKDEKHHAFIKALRKARKQLEEKHMKEVDKLRREMSRHETSQSPELSESDLVKQLHKDNQELAEARDALLKEIDRTQQNKAQDQAAWTSQPDQGPVSPRSDQGTDRMEGSDRRQSEKFMEELESLSQRSGSELPFEWELTLSSDDGVFDRELDDEGLCTRAECLEMKRQYHSLVRLYQQSQGESVFIEEQSHPTNNLDDEQRPELNSSEHDRDTDDQSANQREEAVDTDDQSANQRAEVVDTDDKSANQRVEAVNTSQDISEGEFFEESFKDKIQKLESDNIALEKKLCDQLEVFNLEKQQLKQKCEQLQVNLISTATSRQNVEEKLVKQDEMLQSSIIQLRTEFRTQETSQVTEDDVDFASPSIGTNSVETQTDLSGDSFADGLVHITDRVHSQVESDSSQTSSRVADMLEGVSSRKGAYSADNASTPFSQRKNVRTELNFGDPGISIVERSVSSGTSSPTDSLYLPSIDHVEHMMFSDSESSVQSPTGRTPFRKKKKEQPIEISFNTKSLVSVKCTEGGSMVNQEQIELTGTVNSAGTIVPEEYAKVALEVHHAEMVEEITKLKKELHDSKAKYAQENAMLKEQVEREHIARQLWLEKKVPDDRVIRELPLATDVIELRQEVAVLKENNKMLVEDNKHLLDQIREKECLMLHFRDKFGAQAGGLEECKHGADTQLLILQKQRDELVQEIQDFHEEHERLLSVLDARTAMEETLRREKQILLEKLVQFEEAQTYSSGKQTELEFFRGEQRRLEQLLLLKDESEKQLLKQKRQMEEEMYEVEGKLKERESFLEEEKHRLLREVKEKNLTILKLETLTAGSAGTQRDTNKAGRRASAGQLSDGQQDSLSLDSSYDEAIEILRNKLRMEYEVKEAELNEQHAVERSQFWQQHNKKLESLRAQHESQMETLRGELDTERDRSSQHDLQLEEQHKQTVARLRDELEEEKAAMLDTVLRQLGELTHQQIQQAKHDNRVEVELQLKAMKVTMEQIHTSQLNLVQADLQAKHAAEIRNLRTTLTKELKEQINSQEFTLDQLSGMEADGVTYMGATSDVETMNRRVTQRYEQLVQRINEQLDRVLPDLEAPTGGQTTELNSAEAIRNLLESQKEEITHLRSQVLSEYETLLQSRTQNVTSQSEQVAELQREIESLQTQYQDQIKTFQEKLKLASESAETHKTQEEHTKELEELRTYYEKHVHDMEKTFSDEISDLRTKYETQISNLMSSVDVRDSGNLSDSKDSMALAKEREYIQRTTMLTVISDSDESSATESPRGANSAVSRLTDMEKRIQEKEAEVCDLKNQLQEEKNKSSVSAEEIKSLKDQLNEFEKKVSDLNDLVTEKDSVIMDLNNVVMEKLQKISELENEKEKMDYQKTDVIPESPAVESGDCDQQDKELKSDDSSSLDLAQEHHELLTKLEDLEHRHKEELDSLRHELEHEKQVEVETMQSEFKVQLEIELKRQAAQLQKTHEENAKNLVHVSRTEETVYKTQTSYREVRSEENSVKSEQSASVGATAAVDDVESSVDSSKDTEAAMTELKKEYENKISSLSEEVEKLQDEKAELSRKHQQDLDNLKSLLQETEEKYDKLVAEMESGESEEMEELLKEKYDQQLELSKQLMQQEFTETLESERQRFMERHRKMMDNFMADRSQEAEELENRHKTELQTLRDELQQLKQEHAKELQQRNLSQGELQAGDGGSELQEDKNGKEKDEIQTGDSEMKMKEMMERHETDLRELKEKWEKKVEDLKSGHADELSAAALDTEMVKSELETAHQKELSDLEARLTQLHQSETEKLEAELKTLHERLTQEHEHLIEQLNSEHQEAIDKLLKQHKEELETAQYKIRQEPMREVSELVLPPQTTPLLSAADLDSTQESETEPEFLMKSTPRDTPTDVSIRRGSTPDEMLTTRSFAEVVRGAPPIGSEEEMQEKEEKIRELECEVEKLRAELKQATDTRKSVEVRRGSRDEDESSLVTMLRSDLDRISVERDAVQSANDRLLQVLSESVKSYVSVEDLINKKLARLVNQSQSRSRPSSGTPREDRHGSDADLRREGRLSDMGARAASPRSDRGGDANTSQDSMALEETSILSCNTDEGLDLSQRLTESIFTGPELDPEGEEILTDARGRLQTSVNHLLEMIEKTTQQLLEAKRTQQELVDTLASRSSESDVLEARCTDVEERLREEVTAKEYLAIELHKAEGLISGYSTERVSLEQKIDTLEEQRHALALELETTQTQLQVFQSSQEELQSRQDVLTRQEQILQENIGQEAQALLQEVNTLTAERRELEKQTKHQLERSMTRIQELELMLEETERLHEQTLEERRVELEDLRLQLDSVERQLKASKQFLSEQSGEREQEREEYQREVERLHQLLDDKNKKQSAEGRLQREVQDLSEQLENRIASEGELDEQTRRLQQVLQDKEMTATELKEWVAQLEKEVDEKISTERELRQKIERLEQTLSLRPIGDETSDSSLNSTAEQRYVNPDLMSPDRRSPIRRQITLEEELEKTKKTREELALERDALQQQVQEQLLQISALKNQLDDMRHYGAEAPTATHTSQLRERLAVERESLEMKEEEVTSLQEQKERLKQELSEREAEVQRLRIELSDVDIQLPPDPDLKVREENANLKAEVEKLLGHQEDSAEVGMPQFAQDLLDEKNREIDDLTEQISELQMALEATSVIDDSVRENDELEILREELRQKSDTIQELQEKLTSRGGQFFGEMSLTDADRSLLETSFSEKSNFQQELEETIAQREDEVSDLRKELETAELQLTEVESEKVSLKTALENRISELEGELESVHEALRSAEDKLASRDSDLMSLQDGRTLGVNTEVDGEEMSTQTEKVEGSHSAKGVNTEGDGEEMSTQTEKMEGSHSAKGVNTEDNGEEMSTQTEKVEGSHSAKGVNTEDNGEEMSTQTEKVEGLHSAKGVNTEDNGEEMSTQTEKVEGSHSAKGVNTEDNGEEMSTQTEKMEGSQSAKGVNTEAVDAEAIEELKNALKESETRLKESQERFAEENVKVEELTKQLEEVQGSINAQETEEEDENGQTERQESADDLRNKLIQESEKVKALEAQLKEAQESLSEEKEKLQQDDKITELEEQLEGAHESLKALEEEKESLSSQLSERECELLQVQDEWDLKQLTLEQVNVQIDSFQDEIKSLTAFQNELQKDFDTVQAMLEEKEKEIETLTKELTESRLPPEGATSEIQDKYESQILSLKKVLQEKENIIEEKEEELYVLNEKLELQDSLGSELSTVRQQLADAEVTLDEERLVRQQVEDELQAALNREANSVKDDTVKDESSIGQLQEQLAQKEEKLDSVRAEVEELKERLSEQQKELNDAWDRLQGKEDVVQTEGEKDVLLEQLQSKVTELELELQRVNGQVGQNEALHDITGSGRDGTEVVEEDQIVVSVNDEVEGVVSKHHGDEGAVDMVDTTVSVEQLNNQIRTLEKDLKEKESLIGRLQANATDSSVEDDVHGQLKEMKQQYDQLLTDKIILEKSVIELELKLEEKIDCLEKLNFDKNELVEKEELIAQLQQRLQETEDSAVHVETQGPLTDETTRLQHHLELKNEEVLILERECEELKQRLEAKGDNSVLQAKISAKQEQIEELETKYEDLKQQMREEASRLEEEIQKIHHIQETQPDIASIQEAHRKAALTAAELEKAQEKLEATETTLEQTLVQLAERDEQIKALFSKGQNQLSVSSQEEAAKALEDAQQEVYQLSLELQEKEEDIDRLQSTLTSLEEELDTTSAQLTHSQSELKKQTSRLRETEERLKQTSSELSNVHRENLSASLPLDLGDSDQLMIRSESEPALNNWRRESHLFKSRLHEVESLARQQKQELCTKNRELSLVRKQLEQWLTQDRGEGDAGALVASLQQELKERDRNIQLLQTEIDELNETLLLRDIQLRDLQSGGSSQNYSGRESSPPESEQQIRHLKLELRKAKSALAQIHHSGDFLDRTPEGSATEEDHSPVRLGDDSRNLRREVHQLREELDLYRTSASMSARDFVKKVMELRQELSDEHKNHVRDIQERLKIDAESQLTTLQLRHDDEMKQLRHQHENKMRTALAEQKQELEKQHKEKINRLIIEHKQEVDMLRDEGLVRDDGSVTDLRNALIQDIQTTQDMDNRLIEHLQRPEGVGGEDSDTSTMETSSLEAAPPSVVTDRLQTLLSRLHKRGVHVLTLTELQFIQRHMTHEHMNGDIDLDALRQAWERERETLLSTINSLKELLTRVHRTNSVEGTSDIEDWRGDLISAVCDVFDKEREALMAELRSFVTGRPDTDNTANNLQQRISDQGSLHRSALDLLQSADRKSLLTEIGAIRKKASVSRQQVDEQQQNYTDKISALEDQSAKQQRQQQRQIQVLEYKLQQERVIQEDLKTSLDLERQRVREVSRDLSQEKNTHLETQSELSTVQIQLSKARDALEREHNRYKSVTDALEEERTKNSRMGELLEVERRKCALLDSQVLDLHSHNKDYLEKESRFVEQLRVELEREREKRIEFSRQAEQERGAKLGAQQELEEERRRMKSIQSDGEAVITQLKLALEAERARIEDLNRNLDDEHQTLTQLQSSLELERKQHQQASNQDRAAIEDIEARLRSEQTQVEDLHRSLARERQKLSSVSEMLETERENMKHTMEHERAVCRQLKRESEDMQNCQADLQRQVEFERETVKTYQNQVEQLHEEVKLLKQRENEMQKHTDSAQGSARKTIRELERDRDQLNIKVHELELETDRLRDKVQDTQLQLDSVQGREMHTRHELEALRLTTANQQKSQTRARTSASVEVTSGEHPSIRSDNLDNFIQRLEFVTLRMQDDSTLTSRLGQSNDVDAQNLSSYVSDIRDVIEDMRQCSEGARSHQVQGSASAGQLANERIVKHNAELTTFLNRVCREKEELRAAVDSLEEKLATSRSPRQQIRVVDEEEDEDRYLQDRMAWASERLSLQMALDTAQYEIDRLQAEVRLLRSQANSEGYLTEADREKMQRLYGKFLRAESFRKALVYQKRYLLLLLGGYQDCEQETLMLIAQMGGYPSDIDVQRRRRHTRFFSLFRSAARVVIAIARMRYMVRKWRRAIRVGSPVVGGRVNVNLGYMPSSSSAYSSPRPASSPRHFPSMSRIPDLPSSAATEPLIVLNRDLAASASASYQPSTSLSVPRRQFTTPPTKDPSASPRISDRSVTSSARRRVLQDTNSFPLVSHRYIGTHGAHGEESTDDFLHRLESLQNRLGSYETGVTSSRSTTWR